MSAQPESAAPTPVSLEDAFSALDTAPTLVDQHGAPLSSGEQVASEAQPVEAPEATQEAAATEATEQQPGESDIDYKARVAELERMIENREWSSQGRLRQAEKKLEAAQARIKQLEEGYTSEDDQLRSIYDLAIANAESDLERENITLKRDQEISKRQATRRQQQEEAQRQATEVEQQAQTQVAEEYRTQVLRTQGLNEFNALIDDLGQHFELPEEEVAGLRAIIDTPQNRLMFQTAPPAYIAAWSVEAANDLARKGRAAQARVVARNREQASEQGTYRGPVPQAVAPPQPVMGRDTTKSSTDDLAEAFAAFG